MLPGRGQSRWYIPRRLTTCAFYSRGFCQVFDESSFATVTITSKIGRHIVAKLKFFAHSMFR